MGITKIVNHNFVLELFENGYFPDTYSAINNERSGQQYLNTKPTRKSETLSSQITEIKCIPKFLTPIPRPIGENFKMLEIKRIYGFHIDLSGFSSVHDYMRTKMSSKHRARLKSSIKRLESCFNINYEVYFGSIEKDQYDELFNALELLSYKRFEQIGQVFDQSIDLVQIRKKSYSMILDKRASFHVIYDNFRPIHICLNYHFQDILGGTLRSYDFDYAKFSLGHIDILKHVEWCIENNYKIFDFMWEDLPYKRDWCNEIGPLSHHFFYNPKLLSHKLLVQLRVILYRLKDFIKAKKTDYTKIWRSRRKRNSNKKYKHPFVVREMEGNNEMDEIMRLPFKEIDIHLEPNLWLKPLVFNFQYRYKEHSNDVSVRKLTDKANTYAVLGKNNGITISKPNNK